MTSPISLASPADSAAPVEAAATLVADYRPGYEVVAERLIAFIVEEGLHPGDRLPTEKDLADRLGVSRSVTREAVKILSALGRVRVRRGSGLFVAETDQGVVETLATKFQPTSLEHVRQLLEYRRIVECQAAELAARRATPPQVTSLRSSAQASLDTAAETGGRFAEHDRAFHAQLAAASQNFLLVMSDQLVHQLQLQANRLLFTTDTSRPLVTAARQHVAIAEAVSIGDAQAAVEAMVDHMNSTLGEFERRITARILDPGLAP